MSGLKDALHGGIRQHIWNMLLDVLHCVLRRLRGDKYAALYPAVILRVPLSDFDAIESHTSNYGAKKDFGYKSDICSFVAEIVGTSVDYVVKIRRSRRQQKVRLWAVVIEAHGTGEAATILLMAKDVQGALNAVERRHPQLMRPGNKGQAWLCDHAVYRPASGRFEYKRLLTF